MHVLIQKTDGHELAIEKLDATLDRVRDRLPNWATWAMTLCGCLIGALATWVATCIK